MGLGFQRDRTPSCQGSGKQHGSWNEMLTECSNFKLEAGSKERKLGMAEPLNSQSPLPVTSSSNKITRIKPFQTVQKLIGDSIPKLKHTHIHTHILCSILHNVDMHICRIPF